MIFFEACSQDPLAHSIAEDFDKANPNQKMWTLFILFTIYLYTFIILYRRYCFMMLPSSAALCCCLSAVCVPLLSAQLLLCVSVLSVFSVWSATSSTTTAAVISHQQQQ